MQYVIVQKKNPLKPDDPQKFYMGPVYGETYELEGIARHVAARSSMALGNTISILHTLVDVIPELMMMGHIVSLGTLGRFRLIPSCPGVDERKDFSTRNIRRLKVCFRPSTKMHKALADITYEEMYPYGQQTTAPVGEPVVEQEEIAD
jgi:predicted histone-like DNA-binding protein